MGTRKSLIPDWEIEHHARRLCEIRGEDPDKVEFKTHEYEDGMVVHTPFWKSYFDESRSYLECFKASIVE